MCFAGKNQLPLRTNTDNDSFETWDERILTDKDAWWCVSAADCVHKVQWLKKACNICVDNLSVFVLGSLGLF